MQDEAALGKLMQDFYCTDAENMNYSELAEKVRYFKENERGVNSMCRAMELLCEEAAVRSTVEAYQDCGLELSDILKRIMNKFNLSENNAKNKVDEFLNLK